MATIARVARPAAARLAVRPSVAVTGRMVATRPASRIVNTQSLRRAFSSNPVVLSKLYTKDHEWIELSEDKKSAVIGITDYASEALGDVVYVELPEVDAEISVGDPIGGVESVKSASDINAPVSCTVTGVNTLLDETPGLINKAPENAAEGGGWVARVKLAEAGTAEMQGLMSDTEYKEYLQAVAEE